MPDKRVHPSNRSLVLLLVISCLHMCMNAFRLTNAHTGIIIQRPSSMRYYTNAHTGIMQQHTTPHIRVGDTPETCHMLARNPQTQCTHTRTHAHTHTHNIYILSLSSTHTCDVLSHTHTHPCDTREASVTNSPWCCWRVSSSCVTDCRSHSWFPSPISLFCMFVHGVCVCVCVCRYIHIFICIHPAYY